MSELNRIVIAAAGTGGHVFPGLAVAEEFNQLGHQVFWIGTPYGMESQLVPSENIKFYSVNAKGVRGKGIKAKCSALLGLLNALIHSFKLLKTLRPSVVLCMGGYISGPVGLAAKVMGIPLVIHEQNAIAGTANKILSRFSSWNLQAFPHVFKQVNTSTVGNPLRSVFDRVKTENQNDIDKLKVLIVGGSLGAQVLNNLMPSVYDELKQEIVLWHQAGKRNINDVREIYNEAGFLISEDLRVDAFIADMSAAYAWADIVICRSGAMTVSELAAAGKPSILIPFPYAIDDHQTANARWLSDQGAAKLLPQDQLNKNELVNLLNNYILRKEDLIEMGQRAKAMATFHATEKVAEKCLELAI